MTNTERIDKLEKKIKEMEEHKKNKSCDYNSATNEGWRLLIKTMKSFISCVSAGLTNDRVLRLNRELDDLENMLYPKPEEEK